MYIIWIHTGLIEYAYTLHQEEDRCLHLMFLVVCTFPDQVLPYFLVRRSEGFPERDIWSLGVMVHGSGQMGELSARRRRRRRHLEIGV